MRADRAWMYKQRDQCRKALNDKFIEGVEEFITYVLSKPELVSLGQIGCPCAKCDNSKFLDVETVRFYLYSRGFFPDYDQWRFHGEPLILDAIEFVVGGSNENTVDHDRVESMLGGSSEDRVDYAILSGWSTHGVMSCPICMEHSKAFYLKVGQKPTFFDCHWQFLPLNHSFRRDKKSFRKGHEEKSPIPQRASSDDLWERVCTLPRIMAKMNSGKLPGFGVNHHWTKRSIFWDLPYWNTNLIEHKIDVMHFEKNVFDNIFNMVMDVKGKLKDNEKARKDIAIYCNRRGLELMDQGEGKRAMPKALYTLAKDQKRLLCE